VLQPRERRSRDTASNGKLSPWAVVSPQARIGRDVRIGPFSVIEPDVTIEDGCVLHSRVVVKSGATLGPGNQIFEGAVIGGLPQHIHMPERPGRVVIGAGNTLRENVTIHRALEHDEATTIGDNNFLMVNVHVAHDCRLGNNTIFANNVMLAGHVTVGDRAYVSGAVVAMVGGQAHIVKDVPPFVTIDGLSSHVVGLNQIGLRRAGYSQEAIAQLKEAYRVIYRSGLSWNQIVARLQEAFAEGPAALFAQFLATTTRGIVSERRLPPGATIKLRRDAQGETEEEYRLRIKAG